MTGRNELRPQNTIRDTVALPQRLDTLDVLRGLAALSVVFWHWQHFIVGIGQNQPVDKQAQPYYHTFALLYEHGLYAVDLFFVLSGFIFFLLYAAPIGRREVSARNFFVLRFSRLYPLHLLTLVLVVVLQSILFSRYGDYFVFGNFDLRHFFLNLFLVSAWGFEDGGSFNAPVWSVSVEVFLYFLFFLVCRRMPMTARVALAGALTGYLLTDYVAPLGRGLFAFYAGVLTSIVYRHLARSPARGRLGLLLVVPCAAAWAFVVLSVGETTSAALLADTIAHSNRQLPYILVVTGLFPITLLTLALLEAGRPNVARKIAFLGNLSYSSYLIHFPLQLLFVLVLGWLGAGGGVFFMKSTLLLFIVLLVTASLMSHAYFETPTKRYLRKKLMNGRTPVASRWPVGEVDGGNTA